MDVAVLISANLTGDGHVYRADFHSGVTFRPQEARIWAASVSGKNISDTATK